MAMAGNTGMAGAAGSGGTAGTPGMGGTAGMGGEAGMAGEAGTGGTAGTGGAAGAGGEAGAGGMGGMAPPPPNASCEGREIPSINNSPGADPSTFTFNGAVEAMNNFSGSCSSPGLTSPDTVLAFTAPSAGAYLFSLEGTEFDTVLYVRSDCSDRKVNLNATMTTE